MKRTNSPTDQLQQQSSLDRQTSPPTHSDQRNKTAPPYSFQNAVDHSPRVVAQAMFAEQGTIPSHLREPASPVQRKVKVEVQPQAPDQHTEVTQALAVQIIPPTDGRNVVGEISINGRPEKAYADSMGDHTTAFIVHVSGIRLALEGKSYPDAIRLLISMSNVLGRMPGSGLVNNGLLPDRKKEVYDAKNALEAAMLRANHAITQEQQPPSLVLQRLINLYLEFRELLPLSAINIKSKSPALAGKGKGESGYAATLRGHETGEAKANNSGELQAAIWGLFDASSTAMMAVEASPQQAYEMAPGAHKLGSPDERMAAVWKQHLMSIEMSFPKAYADSNIANGDLQTLKKYTITAAQEDLQAYQSDVISRLNEAGRSWAELGSKRFTPEPTRFKSGQRIGQLTFASGQKRFLENCLNIHKNILICQDNLLLIQRLEKVVNDDSISRKLIPMLNKFQANSKVSYIMKDAKMQAFTHDPQAVFDLTRQSVASPESKSDEADFSSTDALPPSTMSDSSSTSAGTAKSHNRNMTNLDAELPDHFDYFADSKGESKEMELQFEEEETTVMRTTPNVRSLGIQLSFEKGLVSNMSSEGRPPSPFKGTMGAHTTSWIVHLDHIRRNILGKTIQQAFAALDDKVVPFVLKYIYTPNATAKTKTQQGYAQEAMSDVLEDRNSANKHQLSFPELRLQEYIRKILRFINYIPNVTRKAKSTLGRGEGAYRQFLAAYERATSSERSGYSHEKLYQAVFGLFDGGGGNDRMRAAHQRIIAHTYPAVYAALKNAPPKTSSSSSAMNEEYD